jgi:hypothetical protein
MTLEELADLIRANSANGRIDRLHNETYAALLNLQNDMTDVRGELKDVRTDMAGLKADVAEIKRSLDLTSTVAAMHKQLDALAAEVAELKRRAS